jgi:hypothetical protein
MSARRAWAATSTSRGGSSWPSRCSCARRVRHRRQPPSEASPVPPAGALPTGCGSAPAPAPPRVSTAGRGVPSMAPGAGRRSVLPQGAPRDATLRRRGDKSEVRPGEVRDDHVQPRAVGYPHVGRRHAHIVCQRVVHCLAPAGTYLRQVSRGADRGMLHSALGAGLLVQVIAFVRRVGDARRVSVLLSTDFETPNQETEGYAVTSHQKPSTGRGWCARCNTPSAIGTVPAEPRSHRTTREDLLPAVL